LKKDLISMFGLLNSAAKNISGCGNVLQKKYILGVDTARFLRFLNYIRIFFPQDSQICLWNTLRE
jgi:uncharacterized protein YfbU (UPF0304 family)